MYHRKITAVLRPLEVWESLLLGDVLNGLKAHYVHVWCMVYTVLLWI